MSDVRRLVGGSALLVVGGLVASVFSYLYNLRAAHALGPVGYADLGALFSLLMVATVASGACVTLGMRWSAQAQADERRALARRFAMSAAGVGLVVAAIGLLPIGPVTSALSLDRVDYILVLLQVPLLLYLSALRGVFQGAQRFLFVALSQVAEMVMRLGIGAGALMLGYGVTGALAAVLAATGLTALATTVGALDFQRSAVERTGGLNLDGKMLFADVLPNLAAAGLLAVLLNADILIVKQVVTEELAGQYVAISTIAKIILYLVAPVASAAFPLITSKSQAGEKHYQVLALALCLTLLGALGVQAIYTIAPGTLVKALYGDAYVSAYTMLPTVGWFIVVYALVNLTTFYFLAMGQRRFLALFAVLLTATLVVARGVDVAMLVRIQILTAGTLAILVSFFAVYLWQKRDQLALLLKTP